MCKMQTAQTRVLTKDLQTKNIFLSVILSVTEDSSFCILYKCLLITTTTTTKLGALVYKIVLLVVAKK